MTTPGPSLDKSEEIAKLITTARAANVRRLRIGAGEVEIEFFDPAIPPPSYAAPATLSADTIPAAPTDPGAPVETDPAGGDAPSDEELLYASAEG